MGAPLQGENAETIGLLALGWLVGNSELLPVFLNYSGASMEDMRNGARDPAFLGSILDFLTMDDEWVVNFCDSEGLGYEAPLAARQALPGGDLPNWT